MLGEFVKVSTPIVLVCIYFLFLVPDLFKLIPIAIGVGVLWSAFSVAKGFAVGDSRREKENW